MSAHLAPHDPDDPAPPDHPDRPEPPDDDARLLAHVRPAGWRQPTRPDRYDLVVIGGGPAGLVSALGAAGLGSRVALVERHLLGGDCLNTGCVPSKSLLAAAHAARRAGHSGDEAFQAARAHLRRVRADLARHDGAQRLADAGVDVYFGEARFTGPDRVAVGDTSLAFVRCVIATGARPTLPDLPGLEPSAGLAVHTHESLFELATLPKRLAVLGAGPIGCELAQAYAQLGSRVTVFEWAPRILPREDPEAAACVARGLADSGVSFATGVEVLGASRGPAGVGQLAVRPRDAGGEVRLEPFDVLLVATGRRPRLDGLDLAAAGVQAGPHGIVVNSRLRTANRRIYAAGDCCSEHQFTHAADAMSRIALQNALFFGRKKVSELVIPRVTYTEPELAHVGPTAEALAARRGKVVTLTVDMRDLDRAQCEGSTEGFARVHVDPRGRILAATVVGPQAGDLLSEVTLAMTHRLGLSHLARTVRPYPTRGEAMKRLADQWNRSRLTPRVRWLLAAIARLRW